MPDLCLPPKLLYIKRVYDSSYEYDCREYRRRWSSYGESGIFLDWQQNGGDATIILPVTGSFALPISLNGTLDKAGAFPMYISTFTAPSGSILDSQYEIQDIAEMTATTNATGAASRYCSYTVNLTVSGNAGDLVRIRMSGANDYSAWSLFGGKNSTNPGRTCSFVMWQI